MKNNLFLVFVLPLLTSELYGPIEKTEAQYANEKAQEKQRATEEQERKDRDEQAKKTQETLEQRLQRTEQEQIQQTFNRSLEGLNEANKALVEITSKLDNVTTENVALVLQQLREARTKVADTQKIYDTAKQKMIAAKLKTIEPEKPGQMANNQATFAKNMEQNPEAFAQLLTDDYVKNFVTTSAQKNPTQWRPALQKQFVYLEKRPDLPRTKQLITDLTRSVLLQSLETIKTNQEKNSVLQEQIKLINDLSEVGLTYASAHEITRIIAKLKPEDFNALAPEQIAILAKAAGQMLKNPEEPQSWYGLLLMSNIIGHGNNPPMLTKETSDAIQTKVTEALDKRIPFGGTKNQGKKPGLLGEYAINQIASAKATTDVVTLFEGLVKIAAKNRKIFTGNDINQLRTFLKAKQEQLAFKEALQTRLPKKTSDTKKTSKPTLQTIAEQADLEEAELLKMTMPLGTQLF